MKTLKYRIVRNDMGAYKIQRRNVFGLWFDCDRRMDPAGGMSPRDYDAPEKAYERLRELADKDSTNLRSRRWKTYGDYDVELNGADVKVIANGRNIPE